jgi:hypothetical protein
MTDHTINLADLIDVDHGYEDDVDGGFDCVRLRLHGPGGHHAELTLSLVTAAGLAEQLIGAVAAALADQQPEVQRMRAAEVQHLRTAEQPHPARCDPRPEQVAPGPNLRGRAHKHDHTTERWCSPGTALDYTDMASDLRWSTRECTARRRLHTHDVIQVHPRKPHDMPLTSTAAVGGLVIRPTCPISDPACSQHVHSRFGHQFAPLLRTV